jgi:hypothetical protein
MIKKIVKIFLVLSIASCSLITETNISDETVFIVSPPDNLKTPVFTQTLWWDHVDDAEKYNVIIVSPRWDSVVTLIADTNVSDNKFSITLNPGEYDWGVSAYNSSSKTVYSVSHITIDSSSKLTGETVTLLSPKNNLNTNNQNINFSWDVLPKAESYVFDIKYNSWDGENVINTKTGKEDTLSLVLEESVYYWGVKAINEFSQTNTAIRTFIVDITPPGKPDIENPIINDTVSGQDLLIKWNRPGTQLSDVNDSLLLSTDSLFKTIDQQFIITGDPQKTVNGLSSGKQFVRVITFDMAGNVGEATQVRFFIDEE